jgi:DNA helicase-2/ATP-dependent DNA helicase PcrA
MVKSATTSEDNDIIAGLDEYQKAAALAIDGPVAIVAGAGTGKTRTITHRIAYACRSGSWQANHVLAVTFTAKAAREMRERLAHLGIERAVVNTFHAQALSQLHYYWSKATGKQAPQLEANKLEHVLAAASYHNVELSRSEAQAVSDEITWCKVSLIAPGSYEDIAEPKGRHIAAPITPRLFARVFDEYDNIKAQKGLIDFEDALLVMIHLISTRPAIATEVRETHKHIIVDEYQDVSPLQQKLLECWLGKSRELCVVGDPSQTIYSFTGASAKYLLDFEKRWEPKFTNQSSPQRINLINDYRSSKQIVKLANWVLRYRGSVAYEPLELVSKAPDTKNPIRWNEYPDDQAEASETAQKIQSLIESKSYKEEDIAILTRTNFQLNVFYDALRSLGVRCYIKQDNSNEQDSDTKTPTGVTLASLHSSKGLEWECVFLAGLSDGQMPISRAKDEYAIEEERRLLYVGITRAKQQLCMSFSRSKTGSTKSTRMRSRFLDKIWPVSRT